MQWSSDFSAQSLRVWSEFADRMTEADLAVATTHLKGPWPVFLVGADGLITQINLEFTSNGFRETDAPSAHLPVLYVSIADLQNALRETTHGEAKPTLCSLRHALTRTPQTFRCSDPNHPVLTLVKA